MKKLDKKRLHLRIRVEGDKAATETILGNSLLSCAVRLGDLESVKLLLENGANPDGKQISEWNEIYQYEIKNGFRDLYDEDSVPLCEAARRGDYEIVKLLLQYGANPNKDEEDSTPLKEAVYFCCFKDPKIGLKIVKLLLRKGANPHEEVDFFVSMPLHVAAAYGANLEVMQTLIDAGINVDEKSRITGNTALHEAAQNGNYIQVEILIDKNADINELNNAKQTPLDLAIGRRNTLEREMNEVNFKDHIVKFDIQYKYERTIEFLRKNGAKVGESAETESDGEGKES
jgi:ankyrin repeat protein